MFLLFKKPTEIDPPFKTIKTNEDHRPLVMMTSPPSEEDYKVPYPVQFLYKEPTTGRWVYEIPGGEIETKGSLEEARILKLLLIEQISDLTKYTLSLAVNIPTASDLDKATEPAIILYKIGEDDAALWKYIVITPGEKNIESCITEPDILQQLQTSPKDKKLPTLTEEQQKKIIEAIKCKEKIESKKAYPLSKNQQKALKSEIRILEKDRNKNRIKQKVYSKEYPDQTTFFKLFEQQLPDTYLGSQAKKIFVAKQPPGPDDSSADFSKSKDNDWIIKVFRIPSDEATRKTDEEPIQREIEILRQIYPPGAIHVSWHEKGDHLIYKILMPRAPGIKLSDLITNLADHTINLTIGELAYIALQIFLFLNEVIHKVNVVHGDIKPDNIIIDYSRFIATIIDYGSANMKGKSKASLNFTKTFSAPEVLTQCCAKPRTTTFRVNPISDIYSATFCVISLLCQLPMEGENSLHGKLKTKFDSDGIPIITPETLEMANSLLQQKIRNIQIWAFTKANVYGEWIYSHDLLNTIVNGLNSAPDKRTNLSQMIDVLTMLVKIHNPKSTLPLTLNKAEFVPLETFSVSKKPEPSKLKPTAPPPEPQELCCSTEPQQEPCYTKYRPWT